VQSQTSRPVHSLPRSMKLSQTMKTYGPHLISPRQALKARIHTVRVVTGFSHLGSAPNGCAADEARHRQAVVRYCEDGQTVR